MALASITFACLTVVVSSAACWEKATDSSKGDAVLVAGPLVAEQHGVLLFESQSGLIAYKASDGSKVWEKRNDASHILKLVGQEGEGFVVVADSHPFEFMSLHPNDGSTIWKKQSQYKSIGALPKYAMEGDLMIAAGCQSSLAITAGYIAINTTTGATKAAASLPFPSDPSGKERWYINRLASHSRDSLIAIGVEEASQSCPARWAVIDVANNKTLWTLVAQGGESPNIGFAVTSGRSILIVGDYLSDGKTNASLSAYNALTGEVLWKTLLKSTGHDFHVLSCGLIWTRYAVFSPEDGSVAYVPEFPSSSYMPNPTTSTSSSTTDLYVEGNFLVSRECSSGAKRWQATLPAAAGGGNWASQWQQQPPAALEHHSSSSTCQADAVVLSFQKKEVGRGGFIDYSKAVALSKDQLWV
jgi:outer membrane protein assembly factor BamB